MYYNGHGDLAAEADGSGARTALHTYTPFGAPTDTLPVNSTAQRFTGAWDEQTDSSSGLILMGARPYDPTLGRFLAVDPFDGGSLNNYDYAGQDPINGYDLSGDVLQDPDAGGGGSCQWNLYCPIGPASNPSPPSDQGGGHGKHRSSCSFRCKVGLVVEAVYGTADFEIIGGATVAVGTLCVAGADVSAGALLVICGPPTAAGIASTALTGYKSYREWKNAWNAIFGSKERKRHK